MDEYLALLDTLGVQRAVLVQPSVYGADNRALLDGLERTKSGLRGVAVIDSSAGGLGGCPFAGPGAVGNLATEDLVYLLDGLGIEHGASLEGVMAASAYIQSAVGHPLRSPTWLAGGRPVARPLPGDVAPNAADGQGTGSARAV